MLRTLTARSGLLRGCQLQQWVPGIEVKAALASCEAAAGCQQQCSSFSSSHCQWPQQHQRSRQPSLQQWLQPGAAHHLDGRIATFSTSTPAQQQLSQEQQTRLAQSRLVQFEYKAQTLNMIMPEHTTTPLPLLQAGVLPHPIKTAKHIWSIVQAKINMWSALAAARKNIPGFESLGDSMLLDQFADMYERINKAQASFTLSHIKDFVSKDLYLKLVAQAEQRRIGHWDKIVWHLENEDDLHDPKKKSIKLVEGRLIRFSKDSPFEWLQLTYCIRSKQRFAAYKQEKEGKKDVWKLVAGDPDKVIDVEDYWVFEHKTRTPVDKKKMPVEGARWRLVKRQTRPQAS